VALATEKFIFDVVRSAKEFQGLRKANESGKVSFRLNSEAVAVIALIFTFNNLLTR